MKIKTSYAVLGTTALVGSLLVAGVAFAAAPSTAPGQNKLQCFDGTTDGGFGGLCTLKANGAKGPATLNNTDTNVNGDYSGVYVLNTTISGQMLSQITQLGYNYSGNIAPQPGNLSLNIPVSTDGNNANDAYLFIDAFYCPGTAGVVNIISDATCGIFVGSENFPNWAALVVAHPTWTVGTTTGAAGTLPFVIAERTPSELSALWTVSNVTLGKGGK